MQVAGGAVWDILMVYRAVMRRSLIWPTVLMLPALTRGSSAGKLLLAAEPITTTLSPRRVREFRLPDRGGFRVELEQDGADFVLEFLDDVSHVSLRGQHLLTFFLLGLGTGPSL